MGRATQSRTCIRLRRGLLRSILSLFILLFRAINSLSYCAHVQRCLLKAYVPHPLPKHTILSSSNFSARQIPRATLAILPASTSSDKSSNSLPDWRSMIDDGVSIIGKTTSMLVSVVFFLALAWKRDALMVSFFVGSISNGILSKLLKKVVNQSRPADRIMKDDSWLSVEPSDGGMPSSHAMSMGFIGTFSCLSLESIPLVQVVLTLYVIVSLMYRIRAKLHTWQQVAVGLVIGSCNGAAWWHMCHGTSYWRNLHVMNSVSNYLLVDGILPWQYLAIPATLGLLVVGSFERRISRWICSRKEN